MSVLAAGRGSLRRRAALDRPRWTRPRRHHHRIVGVLDAAVGTGVRALARRTGACHRPRLPDPVQADRDDDRLRIRFNRPQRHNAFSTDIAPQCSRHSTSPSWIRPSRRWCFRATARRSGSGGDLAEFGSFEDPASAHLARTRHSPALTLDELTQRLGRSCRAEVHGQALGGGLEMAAYCGWVQAHPDAVLGLPN